MGLSQYKCLIQPEPERRVMDSDTRAEITHPAQKPIPYAFSHTLQIFEHFRILFMTRIPIYDYLGIGVIMGNIIKSARNHNVPQIKGHLYNVLR